MRLLGQYVKVLTIRVAISQHRSYAKSYKATLNLPRTAFPLSMKDGAVSKREATIQKRSAFQDLYTWQKEQEREKKFVLHDGPPYANGEPHVGHALNKILKDFTNRYKVLQGLEVNYVPGWDCHGLPIEHKALAAIRADYTTMDPLDIRQKARSFALKTIQKQKAAFKSWGIMGDWDSPYLTMHPDYETREIEVFFDLFQKGYVYQEFMPVHWSPSSQTALAEAELEYKDDHQSTALYVKFPLRYIPDQLWRKLGTEVQPYALIWTTTPWTLPSNQAICYGTGIDYCFAKDPHSRSAYLISTSFVEKLGQLLDRNLDVLFEFQGEDLEGATYRHPAMENRKQNLLPARHVTVEKGTGLVHAAPAHGPEDFQVAINHGIQIVCAVDEAGRFTHLAGKQLQGKAVLGDGNKSVLSLMQEQIIHSEPFIHSYPYDWRTKEPTIQRASLQWFVDTTKIRQDALDKLTEVDIHPSFSGHGMQAQLEARSYWCISRQRTWGVPIPVFYNATTSQPLITKPLIDHLTSLFRQHGAGCWWKLPQEQLLPKHVLEQSGVDPSQSYKPGRDVLDIWFDSGVSWASVLQGHGQVADVYLEGLDQFGGWFQSSLLTSVASQGKAPYRNLVVHGFAVDEEGKKMSKSVGNVVSPQTVMHGGKNRQKEPAYGVDVMRLWAAQAGLEMTVHIGPSILNRCHEQVFKLRKALRYLMGNLSDYDREADAVALSEMLPQDRFMLHQLHQLSSQHGMRDVLKVTQAYEDFNYSRVMRLIEKFTSNHVSSFYCYITKDRMYCWSASDRRRRACQMVQLELLEALTRFIAPVLPHLAEEAFHYPPFLQHYESVFHMPWYKANPSWHQPHLDQIFNIVTSLRETFSKTIASENPSQFHVIICARPHVFSHIKTLQGELTAQDSPLCEILQCSVATVLSRPPLVVLDEAQVVDGLCSLYSAEGVEVHERYTLVIMPSEDFCCPRCRHFTSKAVDNLCESCEMVLAEGWDS